MSPAAPARWLCLGAVAAALTACSTAAPPPAGSPSSPSPAAGAASPVAVPSDFTTYQGPGFSFAYPPGYDVEPGSATPTPASPGAVVSGKVFVDSPPGQGGLLTKVLLAYQTRVPMSFSQVLDAAAGERSVLHPQAQQTADRDVSVPGAAAAHRTDITYTQADSGGRGSVTIALLDMHVLGPDGTVYDLAVRGPEVEAAALPADAVLASFRVARP